jgi:predicted Zn-dependent protease
LRFAYSLLRPLLGAFLLLGAIAGISAVPSEPAQAQPQRSISLVRDTETERVLWSHIDPLFQVAGIPPKGVQLFIANDPTLNASASFGTMLVHTGLFLELRSADELAGVLAHETGHLAGGHLVRTRQAMKAAMVPMLLAVAAGVGAMIAGAGDIGAVVMMSGQGLAERQLLSFTRGQESAADQAAIRYLTATGHNPESYIAVFRRMEGQELLSDIRRDPYSLGHPVPGERVLQLQALVDASPQRGKPVDAKAQYEFEMVQAKLRGYTQRPEVTLRQYPETNTSKQARYARAMAYFRQPDMAKSLVEIESLVAEEPDNPYFLEMLAQIKVEMGRVEEGIAPYQKAVRLLPDAPLIRVALGAALLGTENPIYNALARQELETALLQETDNAFAWYELAVAYNRMGLVGKAQLATAEHHFSLGSMPQAMLFAARAQRDLERGTRDWQRANDILAVAQTQMPNERGRN